MRNYSIFLGVAWLGLAAACGGGSEQDAAAAPVAASADHEVVIEEFAYSPAQLKVERGATIRFVNRDAFEHTVTSGDVSGPENVPDGKFDESLPDKGSEATVTVSEAGTFTFYCRQHNAMDGEVVVS